MPFAEPYVPPRPLPPVTTEIERAILDLKAVDNSTSFHKAKDVAAFANHLGGTLIIGASERDGHHAGYLGTDAATAARTRTAFEEAITARCSPLPMFGCEEYPNPVDPTRVIVVVNVWPSMSLVGVRVEAQNIAQGYGGNAFVYPVRTGTQTVYLDQDQVPMYMSPESRRAAVMLSRIPRLTSMNVMEPTRPGGQHTHFVRLGEVRELENVVTFIDESGDVAYVYPLDCVVSVYEACAATTRRRVWTMIVQYVR